MTLFSTIRQWFSIGGLSNNDVGAQNGAVNIKTDAGISVTDERAMQVSAVWACVQYITNSICSLPLNFYTKTDDGGREMLPERNPLSDLFHVSPNQWMKPRDFRKAMTMQLCFWSNAYAEITWSGKRPVAIVPLRPGRMTPVISDDGGLSYHYQTEKGVIVYAPKSIMHLKGFGSDGITGLERGNYARKTLGLSVSADVYASKQFANGGRSGGGYLMVDKWLDDKQRANAKKIYEGMSQTAYNTGKLWMLEGGVKYESDNVNPDTMQMIQTRKMQLGEIARFFGVPEVLIGAGGGGTSAWPASFEQQLLSFLTFTLQDYIDEWETAIKDSLMSDKRKHFADHDVSGFIKMDSKTRAEVQSIQTQNGFKTRNEVRVANNDPKMEGGDELTVQVNLAPIDVLGDEKDNNRSTNSGNEPVSTSDKEKTSSDSEDGKTVSVKEQMDGYGSAVRSGSITPQPEDEAHFRSLSGLPPMSKDVVNAWDKDGKVRRPITLQSGNAFAAAQEDVAGDSVDKESSADDNQGNSQNAG